MSGRLEVLIICSYFIELNNNKLIQNMLSGNMLVTVLDLTNCFTVNFSNISSEKKLVSQDSGVVVKRITTIKKFKQELSENENAVILKCFTDRWYDWFIHMVASRYKHKVISYSATSNILNTKYVQAKVPINIFFRRLFRNWQNLLNIMMFGCFLLLDKLGFILVIDTMFLTSKTDLISAMRYGNINDFCFINDDVYDYYIKKKPMISDGYIVFLAQNFPYETYDIKTEGESPVNRAEYSKELKDLFLLIEKKTAKKIVVCVHPKYLLDNKFVDFGDHLVVQGESKKYIENAQVVFGHFSSALNYAVLLGKPICLVKSRLFDENKWLEYCIGAYQNMIAPFVVNMSCINESDLNFIKMEMYISKDNYESFILNFLSIYHPKVSDSKNIFIGYMNAKYGKGK